MSVNSALASAKQQGSKASAPERSGAFDSFPAVQVLSRRFEKARQQNLSLMFFTPHEGTNGATVVLDGKEYINFSSYNYVGLCGHPEVSQAAKEAVDRFGTSVSASRIVSGQIPLHGELEERLAAYLNVEDCIVFVSGYGTNVTTIGHLFGRNDLVVHDSLAHNSLITGSKLTDAKAISFPHNDMAALEALLAEQRGEYDKVLLSVESLYSMDGDIAPLPEIVDIRKAHNSILMVDEAHSLGVLGETGRGIAEHFGISRGDVDIWMGTLSKTFASCGGFVAGDRTLVEYLRYSAPGFIFSVGLSPPDTAAALAALKILEREPWRVQTLQDRSALFRQLASDEGIKMINGEGPIIPVIIGDSYKCMTLAERLLKAGIHVQPIVYPAVSVAGARLRFFMTVDHTEEQIRKSVEVLATEIRALAKDGVSR
jgi:8-amino-7-oxononanoate synthase